MWKQEQRKSAPALVRFAFGVLAIAVAALACRQGQPASDPKPAPNSPLPQLERPTDDDGSSTPPSPLAKDGG